VNVITVEDPKTRRIMLERGDIDVAQVNTRALPYFQAVPNAQVQSGLQQLQVDDVILFNQKIESRDNPWIGSGRLDGQGIPPDFFSDVEIRKGFAYAFDIQGFIQEAFRGSATRARGPIPVSLLMNGRLPPPQVRPYSLKDATTAFQVAQAGQVWEKGFFLPMAYPEGDSERKMTCRYLQSALVKINEKFRIECRSIAQSKLLEELNARRLSAFVYRWILDYPDAHNAVEPFLGSRGFFAASLGYSNPRADKLIEKALSETDPAIRRSLYIELEALAAYDVPAIFTVETTGAIARTNKVPNWIHHPMQPYGNLYEVTKLP
jgi:peptide/nickel transport system substrate-binding protein